MYMSKLSKKRGGSSCLTLSLGLKMLSFSLPHMDRKVSSCYGKTSLAFSPKCAIMSLSASRASRVEIDAHCILWAECHVLASKVMITMNCDQVCKRTPYLRHLPAVPSPPRPVTSQIASALILRHYLFRCFAWLLQRQLIMNSDKLMALLSRRHRPSLISVPITEGNFLSLLLSLKDGTQRVDIGMTDSFSPKKKNCSIFFFLFHHYTENPHCLASVPCLRHEGEKKICWLNRREMSS